MNPRLKNLQTINYRPREIHAIKGTASHAVIAHIAMIKRHEEFRADPRFPLHQLVERRKRYDAIFKGAPYRPIFA